MKIGDSIVTGISYLKQKKKRKLIQLAWQLRSKKGIEIGGPSNFFRLKTWFPVYAFADRIDGVNFSSETVWEGKISQGENYQYYPGKTGHQFIGEATDLKFITDNSYDFLLSCHNLEHVANPLKAIFEWKRILKEEGLIILILPDRRSTFDFNRPYTSFRHLLEDYQSNVDEKDRTHFEEIIKLHDFTRDPGKNTPEILTALLEKNIENRCAHHHVFNQQLVKEMFEYCGFRVDYQIEIEEFHLLTVATKIQR